MKTILITGGSGLIGKSLTDLLLNKGYIVHHLSRESKAPTKNIKVYKWDLQQKIIDPACIQGVDAIIHLAGEGIAASPWTKKQKKKIIDSRTESIRLLFRLLEQNPAHQVKTIISASGVGYYGNRGDNLLEESSNPGSDFLAQTCIIWENAVEEAKKFGFRIVKLRTGVVLSSHGGALKQIEKPIKMGIGSPLGSGKQWMSWIHIDDLARMYLFAIENENISGAYNAASPFPVTNSEITNQIAHALNKSLWAPAVPAFALSLLMGEMCAVVLNSTKTSANKIINAGFRFNFEKIDDALKNIYA